MCVLIVDIFHNLQATTLFVDFVKVLTCHTSAIVIARDISLVPKCSQHPILYSSFTHFQGLNPIYLMVYRKNGNSGCHLGFHGCHLGILCGQQYFRKEWTFQHMCGKFQACKLKLTTFPHIYYTRKQGRMHKKCYTIKLHHFERLRTSNWLSMVLREMHGAIRIFLALGLKLSRFSGTWLLAYPALFSLFTD